MTNYIYRKLAFFVGLNVWGFGLIFAAIAVNGNEPIAWILPTLMLFAGTLMLSCSLISSDQAVAA